ncbi:MAG: DNA replication/repair protein RecF [Pseudomonadota bacterium]
MSDTCFIKALDLRRFRSHAAFSRSFDGRPVAIFGPNGAGKTNIIEAISLLSPGRGLRAAKSEDMAGRPDPIGWAIRATADTVDGERELAVSIDLRTGGRRKLTVDEAPVGQAALGEVLRILWLTPAMDRLWIEGASERRRFLDRTTLAFDPKHAERSAAYERAMRERNRLLKEGVFDPSWLDALEAQMAEHGAQIVIARSNTVDRLRDAQEGASSAFPRADIAVVGEDSPAVDDLDATRYRQRLADSRRRDAAAGRTLFGPHRSDLEAIYKEKSMPARECSTGEQKALLISLVLATARGICAEISAPPILLLDEVAAHLDEGRRASLYDEIVDLGVQAWMTGTGPELFTALGSRAEMLELASPDTVAD